MNSSHSLTEKNVFVHSSSCKILIAADQLSSMSTTNKNFMSSIFCCRFFIKLKWEIVHCLAPPCLSRAQLYHWHFAFDSRIDCIIFYPFLCRIMCLILVIRIIHSFLPFYINKNLVFVSAELLMFIVFVGLCVVFVSMKYNE